MPSKHSVPGQPLPIENATLSPPLVETNIQSSPEDYDTRTPQITAPLVDHPLRRSSRIRNPVKRYGYD